MPGILYFANCMRISLKCIQAGQGYVPFAIDGVKREKHIFARIPTAAIHQGCYCMYPHRTTTDTLLYPECLPIVQWLDGWMAVVGVVGQLELMQVSGGLF